MAVQSTYTETLATAFPGMRANLVPETVISRTVVNDTMGFGVVAVQAAGDREVTTIPNAATADPATYVGISVRDQAVDPGVPNAYDEKATANIMTKGTIWVTAYETVDAGDPVYFVTATGLLGKTSASSTLIANARWETSRTDAGLAMIRLG
jgi:hypothetical protein